MGTDKNDGLVKRLNMLFNSIQFAIFLPVVFFVYWYLDDKGLRYQNVLLLVASYFFYACWDYRFLFLLICSTLLDFFTGIKMEGTSSHARRKCWFILSVGVNLGILGAFKYYNFFAHSLAAALQSIGIKTNFWSLMVILPIGISFYTFHGLSYVIDVYKKRIKAERNFIDYAVFVNFFPLLIAGPIERATHLLPQIKQKRAFNYIRAVDGLRQILWGLFKKMVIADNCAEFVNHIFGNYRNFGGSTLILAAVLFAVQIYCDFSGYSDIALGTARLFGIDLLRNFAYPYFSRDIAAFWRRWNISLSSWFRDYLYIPLGGSRGSRLMKVRNTFVIFLVSGFWHGANWTFIVWGALHAIYFLPLLLLKKNRKNLETVAHGRHLPTVKEFTGMAITFSLTVLAWIFFRSGSVADAFHYISIILCKSSLSIPIYPDVKLLLLIIVFFLIEWLGREQPFAIARLGSSWPRPVRLTMYYAVILFIFWFSGAKQQFIYFQF